MTRCDDRDRRLASNEAVARAIDGAVGEVAAHWHQTGELIELVCECSGDSCVERIHVPLTDYRHVRENPQRFLLVDAHVNEELERRVGTAGDATIVERVGTGR